MTMKEYAHSCAEELKNNLHRKLWLKCVIRFYTYKSMEEILQVLKLR